jgi:hypothetical protein
VLLGFAILAQVIVRMRSARGERPLRSVWPECLAAAIGGGLFLLWKLRMQTHLQEGIVETDYYGPGWIAERLNNINVSGLFGSIGELFFHIERGGQFIGLNTVTVQILAVAVGLLTLLGLIERIRLKRMAVSDAYVLGVLLLFATLGTNQQIRYLMPIAPFLIHYFLIGCLRLRTLAIALVTVTPRPPPSPVFRMFVGAWLVLHLGSCFQVLLFGNLSRTHAGLCYLVSPTAEAFYRGYWLDLYQACERIRSDPAPGLVALVGEDDKYVTAFTGREWVRFGSGEAFTYLLVMDRDLIAADPAKTMGLTELMRGEYVAVYRRPLPVVSGI